MLYWLSEVIGARSLATARYHVLLTRNDVRDATKAEGSFAPDRLAIEAPPSSFTISSKTSIRLQISCCIVHVPTRPHRCSQVR